MTACPSMAAAAVPHITSGAPMSNVSQHVCEAGQQQLPAKGTLSAAAAAENPQLISQPELPARQCLPQEPPGTSGAAQTPCSINTSPKAAGAEACDPSPRRFPDNQVDGRAQATQADSHDAMRGTKGCLIGSASIPWRTKRKAACLEPATQEIVHAQPESPQKSKLNPPFAATSSRHVADAWAEDAPRTDQHVAAQPAQVLLENACHTCMVPQLAATQCSQGLLEPAICKEPARGMCVGSHEQYQCAADRNGCAPVACEEVGAAASNVGHCPTWVAEEVLQLAQNSITAPLPEVIEPGCLIGRSVCFVLLEDFDAGGDSVMRGIKTGRCHFLTLFAFASVFPDYLLCPQCLDLRNSVKLSLYHMCY